MEGIELEDDILKCFWKKKIKKKNCSKNYHEKFYQYFLQRFPAYSHKDL